MIQIPDRIAICSYCERKEVIRCPELGCNNCLCQKCFDTLDKSIINRIEPKSIDEEVELSETETSTFNENDEESEEIEYDNNNFDDSESYDSDCISLDYLIDKTNDQVDHDELEDFVTNGATDIDYDSDNSCQEEDDGSALGDFDITTDAGDVPFQIVEEEDLKQTRGMNITGHVILNFVGSLLTRKRHQLKSSSIHKYFLQRIVTTSIGKSVSLIYPEAMLFPSIFWLMREQSLIGAIPATLLNEKATQHGFASIPQHVRSRLTSSSFQTSTNNRYTAWSYDVVINHATNNHHTSMVVNKGLTASSQESSGLELRGGNKDSALLDCVDSKQIIKNLMASQKYYPFDFFLSFTCNMKQHFGVKPIKEWIDGSEWTTNFPGYDSLQEMEKEEIRKSLEQAASGLLLRA